MTKFVPAKISEMLFDSPWLPLFLTIGLEIDAQKIPMVSEYNIS
jgi:hypothetical protein|tara:strand:+ start:6157 stop:6288 length:132 start_codon:yes stop_codon:yes gene_type:complete